MAARLTYVARTVSAPLAGQVRGRARSCLELSGRTFMDPVKKLSRSVRGLSVLVTGAASGMGRATAHVFAREGAKDAVTNLRLEPCEAIAADIRAEGGEAQAWSLNVGDAGAIARVVPEIAERLGGLDIVVNNAGVTGGAAIDAANYEEVWERALPVLLTAHPRIIRAALPYLRKSKSP